ncbi:MAG: hypothetical protein PHW63_10230 [Alphaproteobacteria bacterium]|nr:hypothetical protein [Alphaproteobacteria bacterium]
MTFIFISLRDIGSTCYTFAMPQSLGEGIIGHAAVARILESSLRNPAPAYLFYGQEHTGKRTLAERFVRSLLDLEVLDANWLSHPDLIIVEPDEGKVQVSVEQIRNLRERLSLRPARATRTVTYVPHADRLNESGTNALLKVIEEPPAGAVFVFVVEDLGRIPMTVRSRSVNLPLFSVPFEILKSGLMARGLADSDAAKLARSARGRPGLALEPQVRPNGGTAFATQFLNARNVGLRLELIEELSKACESESDSAAAWREALVFAMQAAGSALLHEPVRASVFGLGLLTALRSVGGALSPRLALEACALKLDGDAGRLAQLFPDFLPAPYPKIFNV